MGRRFSAIGDQAAAASESIQTMTATTAIRPRLYELIFGSAALPADQAFNMQLNRTTTDGTGSAITSFALDPDDPVSVVINKDNHTSEPTYTSGAVMLNFSINQQATFRWAVPPDEGIMCPATANNGLGLRFVLVSGGSAVCQSNFHYHE